MLQFLYGVNTPLCISGFALVRFLYLDVTETDWERGYVNVLLETELNFLVLWVPFQGVPFSRTTDITRTE
jgi:hypothetical protein